jgi:hypothetical protein
MTRSDLRKATLQEQARFKRKAYKTVTTRSLWRDITAGTWAPNCGCSLGFCWAVSTGLQA